MRLLCTDKNGFRPVNNREARALIFTFGVKVGCSLIDIIKLEYDPALVSGGSKGYKGRVEKDRQIKMRSEYNPENLRWLGIFIHEAVHIWQRETGCHQVGEGGKNYSYTAEQLPDLNFLIEQHARAVQDWFYVNYGIESGMLNAKNQIQTWWLWWRILPVFGRDRRTDPRVNTGTPAALRALMDIYEPVIEEIRDPSTSCPRD